MSYNGDIALYLSGGQVAIPECGIYVTPPTVRQICQFGEDKFFQALGLVVKLNDVADEIKQGNFELSEYDNFQILIAMLQQQEDLNDLIISFFGLVCPDFEVSFSEKTIDFKLPDSVYVNGRVHTYNFPALQEVISEMFLPQDVQEQDYNPANEAAAKIAEKLRKAKEKIKGNRSPSDDKVSIISLYVSSLSVGMCIDMNTLFNYTLFQIYDTYNRYWLKVKYDMYQKIATTPMMDVSKMEEPREWAQNLYGTVSEDTGQASGSTNKMEFR